MQSPEDPSGRPITEYRTINERSVHHSGSFIWVHAFFRAGREAPVRTDPFPSLERRSMLKAIVVVVVLVLDCSGGSPVARG
jgi:hypothetical protein